METEPMTTPGLMTTFAVAKYFSVSCGRVRNWEKRGLLLRAESNIDGTPLFKAEDVERFTPPGDLRSENRPKGRRLPRRPPTKPPTDT